MHEIVSFDQIMLRADEASLPALSSSALYGRGVFTTVAVYGGEPFLWEKHWKRLMHDSAKIGLDLSGYKESHTKKVLDGLIKRNEVTTGRARVTFFDESPSDIWSYEHERRASLLIMTGDRREFTKPLRLEISNARVSTLSKTARIKSCNYVDTLLAYEETRANGYDEAIRLNEAGEVVSACMANVFWVKDGRLFTPDIEVGCVPGTTREYVLEKLECEVVREVYDTINTAESIFLTSAGLGVAQVAEFAGMELEQADHPIMHVIGA